MEPNYTYNKQENVQNLFRTLFGTIFIKKLTGGKPDANKFLIPRVKKGNFGF